MPLFLSAFNPVSETLSNSVDISAARAVFAVYRSFFLQSHYTQNILATAFESPVPLLSAGVSYQASRQ